MKNDLLLQTMSCKKLRYKIAFTYITKKKAKPKYLLTFIIFYKKYIIENERDMA